MKWNQCDYCGKFIGFNQMNHKGGASRLFVPDSECTYEEFFFRCKTCTKKHGKPTSHQGGVNSDKCSCVF